MRCAYVELRQRGKKLQIPRRAQSRSFGQNRLEDRSCWRPESYGRVELRRDKKEEAPISKHNQSEELQS
jgi:hypothetical protein